MPRELEVADGVVFQIVLPFLDDLVGRNAEVRLLLAGFDFGTGEGGLSSSSASLSPIASVLCWSDRCQSPFPPPARFAA